MINNAVKRHLNKLDYFGERALLFDEVRSASVVAEKDTTC